MRKVIFVFLCISNSLFATNYYVKNGGSDSANGLSDATAWATISKVNSFPFSPGDSVLFKRGSIWREVLTVPASGSQTSYTGFSGYGAGANPAIYGSNITTWDNQGGNIWKSHSTMINPRASYNCDLFFNSSGKISWGFYKATTGLLTSEFDWTWSGSYIYIYAVSDPATRYTAVEVPQRISCINLNSKNNLSFKNLELRYTIAYGFGDGVTPQTAHTGLIIDGCKIAYIGGNITSLTNEVGYGIAVPYSNMIVRNCEIFECGRRLIDFHLYGLNWTMTNVLIEDNYLHDAYHTTGVDMSVGSGSYYTAGINGIIIRRNLMEDVSNRPGYLSELMFIQNSNNGAAGAKIKNIYVYSNIFRYPSNAAIHIETGDSVFIYNNTFYGHNTTKTANCWHINIDNSSTHITIKNNLFFTPQTFDGGGSILYVASNSSPSQVTSDYNIYYRMNNSVRVMQTGSTTYYMNSLATVRSVLGWEIHGQFIDPGLVSAVDYHLLSGSPSINSGTALSLAADYENKTWGTPPSKGAFEYGAATIVAPVYQSSVIRAAAPKSLEMTYNLTLANVIPDTSSFKVLINSLARKVDTVTISGTKVLLALSNPVVYGDIVTISYAKPASNPLQTAAGGEASTLTAQPVINSCSGKVNSPPYIQITSPQTNSSYRAPATITINAAVSDSDGTITRVEFYDGSYKLGEKTIAPYSFTWRSVSRGTYKLTAAATDNLNSKTVSAPVTVTVLNRYSGRKGETVIGNAYSENGQLVSADSLSENSELLTLFPNPNDGHFSVSFVTPLKYEGYLLSIINLTGAIVYKEILPIEAGIRNFDLSYLKSGMYILQISNNGILVTRKFIKK